MVALLQEWGVADGLLAAGGRSVLAFGGPRRCWMIDLRSRRVARPRLARLYLSNGAIATSGAGEQYVDVGGTRYGHVLDPRPGWPAAVLVSVSVVTGVAAGARPMFHAL